MSPRMIPRSILISSLSSLLAMGCGPQSEPAAATASEALGSSQEKLLTSIKTPEGRKYEFRELTDGSLAIDESGPDGQKPVLGDGDRTRTLSEIFQKLQPDTAVPEPLATADRRFFALRSSPLTARAQASGPGSGPARKGGRAGADRRHHPVHHQ